MLLWYLTTENNELMLLKHLIWSQTWFRFIKGIWKAALAHSVCCVCLYLCVSQCSTSCGVGYQQRIVSCSSMPSSLHSQSLYSQPSSAGENCPEPNPPSTQPCLLRECAHTSYWKVGPWTKVKHKTHQLRSQNICPTCINCARCCAFFFLFWGFITMCVSQCSQTCGAGVMERRVDCVTPKGQLSKHCRPSERPESQAACQERQCEHLTFVALGLSLHCLNLFIFY